MKTPPVLLALTWGSLWEDVKGWLGDHGPAVGALVLIGLAATWITGRVVRRARRRLARTPPSAITPNVRRRVTLTATLAYVVLTVAWVVAALAILSELGVDVAPFLASAGVVGVALGFGAQAIVKDFLAGIFIVSEDQFGVGDFVELGVGGPAGPLAGRVHALTLRATQIRFDDGTLATVGNGSIVAVLNRSRGPGRLLVEALVPGGREPRELERDLAEAMRDLVEDPTLLGLGLSDLRVVGVEATPGERVQITVAAQGPPSRREEVERTLRQALARRLSG